MKKKSLLIIVLIIVMALASLMVACDGGEEPLEETVRQTTVTAQEESSASGDPDAATQEAETEAVAEITKSGETVKATETTKINSDKETDSPKPTKESAKQSTKAKMESDKKADSKNPTKESAKEPTKATEAKKVCHITVDGYCSSKQIELKGGESVYDILKTTGASVSARNTGYGLYIEGINGRFEFDEGPTSGWVYTVNGTRPNTSCSNYVVKNGDKIVWTYVTEV